MSVKLHIKGARLSFANGLFVASSLEENQTKKFSIDLICLPTTKIHRDTSEGKLVTMDQIFLEVANDTWKGKGATMLAALEPSKKAWRDGNTKLDKGGTLRDGYEDNWYLTAKNATRPGVFAKDGSPVTQEDGIMYSGCYVYGIVEIYGNAAAGKKGVFASLLGVRFEGDGDAFGGGRAAGADEFGAAEGAGANDFA